MQQPRSSEPAECACTIGEENQRNRRRQRETGPCRKRPTIARPHQPNRKSNLAGRRTRQKLAQGDQIDVSLFVEPVQARHEFFTEIPDMRDRPAEGADAELKKNEKDFER